MLTSSYICAAMFVWRRLGSPAQVLIVSCPDIQTKVDIKLLLDTSDLKVNQGDILAPVFNCFAGVDWSRDLPIHYVRLLERHLARHFALERPAVSQAHANTYRQHAFSVLAGFVQRHNSQSD